LEPGDYILHSRYFRDRPVLSTVFRKTHRNIVKFQLNISSARVGTKELYVGSLQSTRSTARGEVLGNDNSSSEE